MQTRRDSEIQLLSIHSCAVSISAQCESALFTDYTFGKLIEGYQTSDEIIGDLVDNLIYYSRCFANITRDESLVDSTEKIRKEFVRDLDSNHNILARLKALADKLASEAMLAWAKI